MDRNITENDLLLYHYNEVDAEMRNYISAGIESNSEWREYIDLLKSIDNSVINRSQGPSNITLSIILEESQHQENPIY